MSEQPQDALSYANVLVTRVLPSLPRTRMQIGRFTYDRTEFPNIFRINTLEINSIVCLSPCATEDSGYVVYEVAYWEKNTRHALKEGRIELENQNYELYPKFDYTWLGGNIDSAKGKLSFLRMDLAGDTFVNYNYESPKSRVFKKGQEALLTPIPESIEGLNELLGTTIPWQIDYDTRAREILHKSMLEEFVREVERRKN